MNYHNWAALMKVMLQAHGLWEAVSHGGDGVDFTEDRMALEVSIEELIGCLKAVEERRGPSGSSSTAGLDLSV
ncbi:hypothetical protein GUJ93_ZPchr0002g26620 [Zizania palustris]|uniref:DUF4219 domain-containing protein n=1 Tax=Zizania palustris TaxID=103762 RepID=A0A8J5VCE9_ZIZPA|nr:hypothetical protein GUJ93_ZPchr0002g24466 [Zizania palustris]KAG8060557.1 hypothetical protein GUJ93_ZPchr0002g26620 [Zizania palustris]